MVKLKDKGLSKYQNKKGIRFFTDILDKFGISYTAPIKVFVPHKLTYGKCAIYGQIIKSGAMMGIEIFKSREHIVIALTLEKI